jgi:hypothetical protein
MVADMTGSIVERSVSRVALGACAPVTLIIQPKTNRLEPVRA